jgi:hypothetical protein
MKDGPRRWPDVLVGLTIFALCLGVYNATLTPSLSYKSPDGNELATVCYTLGLAHSTGYPLYTWLGKLFTYLPVGDVAHRVNLMSATLGAAGTALLYVILRQLTGNRSPMASRPQGTTSSMLASAFGALLFGFSRTFWSQTGIAEVYTANLFMVALTVVLLLQWARWHKESASRSFLWFWAFALAFGLSLGTHLSSLGFAPAFALFVLLVDWRSLLRPWVWLFGAGFFFLGILQFLWLPYKASTLNDVNMLRHAPSTLEGIYDYTLGAFPTFKFAFPLSAIPERIVLYLDLLAQNVHVVGILVGLGGMAALLWQRPRRFFLLIGMYLVHVWFFVQYRAFDIEVFFIPAHLVYAAFIGVGICALLMGLPALLQPSPRWRRTAHMALHAAIAAILVLALAGELCANWEHNDYSSDTAINDFYENVYDLLPPDSALLGQGGVFGFDMFYFRLVYNDRPDVAIPMLAGPRPSPSELAGRPIYSTQRMSGSGGGGGPWSPPPGLVSRDAWYVPVLLGQSGVSTGMRDRDQPLALYSVQDNPPELVVHSAQLQYAVGERLDGLELVGYSISTEFDAPLEDSMALPGGRLHLTLYWRVHSTPRALVVLSLGDTALESHELGLGNLARYLQAVRPLGDGLIVEDYWVVIPSTVKPGNYPLRVSLQSPLPAWAAEGTPPATSHIEFGRVIIVETDSIEAAEVPRTSAALDPGGS